MKRSMVVGLMVAVALGMSGCGLAQRGAEQAVEVAAAMGAEGQALAALGYSPDDMVPVAAPEPSASAEPGRREGLRKRHAARVLLRRNTLHGEAVVQTKEGTKTVLVQRGEITAVDGDSVTVRSADGFTLTWTYADDLHVVEHRAAVQPDALEVGDAVGVAGAKDGDAGVARLIVIPRAK